MDDYKEMGLIYEAFTKGSNPYGRAKDTSRSYPPSQSDNMNHSYGKSMPLKDPGGSGRAYDGAQTGQGIAHVISDEETSAEPKEITNLDVLDKIESLIKDAERFEDTKTIIALDELKRHIAKL
mgnify:CR=1 FL=1